MAALRGGQFICCWRASDAEHLYASGVYSANRPKDALKTYEKGIATAQETLEERPDAGPAKTSLGQMLDSEGNLLVQLKQYDGSIAAFIGAANLSLYPATPYFNLCATYYNLKREQEALAACEQTISSDPNMADAYYIKGSILFGRGHVEHGKYVVPPGTIESLNKYLENAPVGEYAKTVKDMIDKLNEQIEIPYQPAKK